MTNFSCYYLSECYSSVRSCGSCSRRLHQLQLTVHATSLRCCQMVFALHVIFRKWLRTTILHSFPLTGITATSLSSNQCCKDCPRVLANLPTCVHIVLAVSVVQVCFSVVRISFSITAIISRQKALLGLPVPHFHTERLCPVTFCFLHHFASFLILLHAETQTSTTQV